MLKLTVFVFQSLRLRPRRLPAHDTTLMASPMIKRPPSKGPQKSPKSCIGQSSCEARHRIKNGAPSLREAKASLRVRWTEGTFCWSASSAVGCFSLLSPRSSHSQWRVEMRSRADSEWHKGRYRDSEIERAILSRLVPVLLGAELKGHIHVQQISIDR